MTDFPTKGDDQKIVLSNSNFPQFDRAFAERLKEEDPQIWKAGGNIRGNEAFALWGRARSGDSANAVTSWIKEREAWAARHLKDGSQFPGDEPNLSNIAGVVAAIKWGVTLQIGESAMKSAIRTLRAKMKERKLDTTTTTEARHLIGISETDHGYLLHFSKNIPETGPPTSDDVPNDLDFGPTTPPAEGGGGGGGTPGTPQDAEPVQQPPKDAPKTPSKSIDEDQEIRNEITGPVRKALEAKVEEHNEEGPKYRTDLRTLSAVFRRGVGAYKTNPSSVRPSVSSPEQWAHARVNSFLHCLRTGNFKGGKHDTDLLPEDHPLHTEGEEQKHETMNQIERRYLTPDTKTIEIRYHDEDDEHRVEGYAAVFESPTTIQGRTGAFREKIARSAFEGRLEDPVVALFNHDQLRPLSKVGAGLELSVDDYGLRYSFPIPDTTTGRDLVELMKRGVVREASFAFTIAPGGESWTRSEGDEMETRTISKVGRLIDVSVVTLGAYSDASAALRSFEAAGGDDLPQDVLTHQERQESPAEGPETANRDHIQKQRDRIRRAQISKTLQK